MGWRIEIEKKTLERMIQIYCREKRHEGRDPGLEEGICPACGELRLYALGKLDRCVFQDSKPTCARCAVHCYGRSMRERVVEVMRFSGPKMTFRHPWLALVHLYYGLRTRVLGPPARPRH